MNKRRIVKQIVESVVNKLLLGEGEDKPATTFENAQVLLDKGYEPKSVFDRVWHFSEGVAPVELNTKFNYINEEGKILSSQWFDRVRSFKEGFGAVTFKGKQNFINSKGELLNDQWYQGVSNFYNGISMVALDWEYNAINTKGELLNDEWVDDKGLKRYTNGTYEIKVNGKWCKIGE